MTVSLTVSLTVSVTVSLTVSLTHPARAQAKHLFRRVRAPSYADSHEARFQLFATHLWPRLKEADPSGLLIFASSYLEFVRLRNFLKQQGASLAVNCEYTDSSSVMRARARFRSGERKVLLYTERAHFYFRPTLRCAPSRRAGAMPALRPRRESAPRLWTGCVALPCAPSCTRARKAVCGCWCKRAWR